MDAPVPLTMERISEKEELILAQSTSQCCRCCCFQKSINWILSEGDNFQPGANPFELQHGGWVHEESSFCGRTWSACLPGCRAAKYVQHTGSAPEAIKQENKGWFDCQQEEATEGLTEEDKARDVIATHEKPQTCGTCWWIIPICCNLPYLETKDASGKVIGKTEYICDVCLFVPKFNVLDRNNKVKYYVRSDTCCLGTCIMCRCGGGKGKCFRVPFLIRDPDTKEPLTSKASEGKASVTNLWSGWKHECCTQKNAYHLVFPENATPEDKMVLVGSSILLDVVLFEQEDDDNS